MSFFFLSFFVSEAGCGGLCKISPEVKLTPVVFLGISKATSQNGNCYLPLSDEFLWDYTFWSDPEPIFQVWKSVKDIVDIDGC